MRTNHPIIYFVFASLLLTGSCKPEKENSIDITGTWYYIFQDSVYQESIFTKDLIWSYSEGIGTYSVNYEIVGDSLKIPRNDFAAKIISKNKDEFDLVSQFFTSHYYRIKIEIDTSALIHNDEEGLDKYFIGWRERKYNWDREYREKHPRLAEKENVTLPDEVGDNGNVRRNVTVFDTLSSTLGFLDTPLVDDWTEIQFLNPNKTKFSFPVEFLQVKLDYDMFSPFRVIAEDETYYTIDFWDQGHKLYRKSDSTLGFSTWEQHLIKSVAAVGFNPKDNPIKAEPDENSKELHYYHDTFYHPLRLEGDWVFLKKYDEEYGWIKWRDGDMLLIELFYLF